MTKIENIKLLYYCYEHGIDYALESKYNNLISNIVKDITKILNPLREPLILIIIENHVGKFNSISQSFYFRVLQTLFQLNLIKHKESLIDLYAYLRKLTLKNTPYDH